MSWLDWFKEKFLGIPPKRRIARIDAEKEEVYEEVDPGGGPVKPHARRLAIRDRRLQPKARAPLGKKKQVLKFDEAERLFSRSLRNRNRQQRDLLCDPEQLQRLGLPLWKNEADLAEALGLSRGQLIAFAHYSFRERHPDYVAFAIPKRSGGERILLAPKRRLKAVQRKLLKLLCERLPVSEAAHGFRSGRSIASGALPHVGRKLVLRLDLADFFPHCTWNRVRGLLLAYGYSYPVATCLALLTSESERQPVETPEGLVYVPVQTRYCVQGAPTSPALANALVYKLDRRLEGLAQKMGFNYTRYADDLTFSGDDPARLGSLLRWAQTIIEAEGFHLNAHKTRIMRQGQCQKVTGVTVNETLGLSRKERRRIRAALHQKGHSDAAVQGQLAYLHMLNPQQATNLKEKQRRRPSG